MLWVEEGLVPSEVLSAPPGVFKAAIGLVNERRRKRAEADQARDDEAAFKRMHQQLRSGG